MADINDPAPTPQDKPHGLPRDQRTIAPTPEAVKARAEGRGDGEDIAGQALKATTETAEAAKDGAAARASEEAARLREAADGVDPGSLAHAATERLAESLGDAARSIRHTDLGHVTDDLAAFARRQPLLFFGGAALLGFAAGRMFKASERADHASGRSGDTGRTS
jgi:hypothetical protein